MKIDLFDHDKSIIAPYWDDTHQQFIIDGKPLSAQLENYTNPIYIYTKNLMQQRFDDLRSYLPPEINIHYAVKANPNAEVLRYYARKADGLDIASIGELERLQELKIALPDITFAGPGKRAEEIEKAIISNVNIIVESFHQLELCDKIASKLGMTANCMVRLNDSKYVSGSGLSMAGGKTFFGIDIDEYRAIGLQRFKEHNSVAFRGFHFFHGSQNLNVPAIICGLNQIAELLCEIPTPSIPQFINIGGGLGIPYGPKDKPINLANLQKAWRKLVDQVLTRFPKSKLCTELGRFLVGPTGLYICKVIDKKTIQDRQFIITDGGMQHFSAATGNFGQVLKKNHPLFPLNIREDKPAETVIVSGCLCTPIDVFARDVTLPYLEIGDFIILFQAGAYGYTASPQQFLSHPKAIEKVI